MFGAKFCKGCRQKAIDGFTLIEALVALALVSITLVSISALVGVTARSTRSIKEHTTLVSIARVLENGLPDSLANLTDAFTGKIDAYRWQIDFRPFPGIQINESQPSPWIPEIASITVTAPNGASFQLQTIRLLRSAPK